MEMIMKVGVGDNLRPRTNPAEFDPFLISGRAPASGVKNIRGLFIYLFFFHLVLFV